MMKTHKKYFLLSLGCAKNKVDSDSIVSLLDQEGYSEIDIPQKADILIVNTCGFIQSARDESISALKELSFSKRHNQILIAAGCYTERYRLEITEQVPGIDGIMGTRRWMDIIEVLQKINISRKDNSPVFHLPDSPTIGKDEHGVLRASFQGASSYLKIADGCRRPCAFCAIPLIKGPLASRSPEVILQEAKILQKMGTQELILIAQDTTDYGFDLGIKDGLSILLESIVKEVPDIPWLRILYTYPGFVTDRLIQNMEVHHQILPYLDIPLQHAHPDTLRRMKRPSDIDLVVRTLSKMRQSIPDLSLRTTFIVGYPGETEVEFQTLLDFVAEMKFDHVGTFQFSFEKGTASEPLGDPIPADVKTERFNRLMSLQENISLSINQQFIGKKLNVLIEGSNDGISIGRSYRDAPEIDGLVIVENEILPGKIIPVMITSAMIHDLAGRPL
jgi:ribosomal protein S12 methylthiotransferase